MKRTFSDDCGSAAFRLGHYAGMAWRAYRKADASQKAWVVNGGVVWNAFSEWIVARSALRIFLNTVGSREGRYQQRRGEIRKRAGEGFRAGKAAR